MSIVGKCSFLCEVVKILPLQSLLCLCRVPAVCDFEPLNRHVDALHNLVQAAQSVDEMSQTITDLLSEQRVKGGLAL